MTFDLISGLHMQIQTWNPPLWICTHVKYYVKSGRTNVLKKCQQNQKYASFFDSDCQLFRELTRNSELRIYIKLKEHQTFAC